MKATTVIVLLSAIFLATAAEEVQGTPLVEAATFRIQGDYVTAGTGLRNRGYGDIDITGIPTGSTIQKALLYWTILAPTEEVSFKQGKFDGHLVEGTFIGSDIDPCWDDANGNDSENSWSYRADVTQYVSGNGTYQLSDFATYLATGEDPWTENRGLPPMIEGASLVVIYSNSTLSLKDILVYEGNDEFTTLDTLEVTIPGFEANGQGAKLAIICADGQDLPDNNIFFNDHFISVDTLDGSDAQAGPAFSRGSLWDTDIYDVKDYVASGDLSSKITFLKRTDITESDCLVLVALVLSVEREAANQPPNTKIETAEIDASKGTAKFTWSGSDDETPAKDLVYCYRIREDSSYSEWSTWSTSTTKTYTGLSPANYRFQVRAKDGEGAIDPSPASREFAIAKPPPAEWVRICNTPNGIWRLRKDEWTDSGPSDEVLMLLPNQWVLKVVSKTDPVGRTMEDGSYVWWRVENPGNGLVGLMAARKSDGSIEYLVPSDSAPAEIIQEAQARAWETLSALAHYYNADDIHQSDYSSTDLYAANDWGYNSRTGERAANHIAEWVDDTYKIPIEFLLAIAAAETGGHAFSNEVYGTTTGGGIGIMQITGEHIVGYGSNLKCYDCSPGAGVSKLYTNSRQGIHSNIKDGLRVLQDCVWSAFRNWTPPNAEEIPCLAGALDHSLRSIVAVWKYNGGGVPDYLKRVSDVLGSLDMYYGDYRAGLESCGHGSVLDHAALEAWREYFECMDKNKIRAQLGSPAELRIRDAAGRTAGSVDGNPVEEIPGSAYSAPHHAVVVFNPFAAYTYEVHGTDTGLYQLDVAQVVAGVRSTFVATDVPIVNGGTHQYTIDWDALARGEEGVTLQVDNDGDGIFEKTIQAGSTLDGTTTPVGNQPPQVSILAPVVGEVVHGPSDQIQWDATDPDDSAESLNIDLFYSTDEGSTWTSIASNEANDGVYEWEISSLQGGEYRLKIVAEDPDGTTAEATTGPFTISAFEGQIIVAPNPVTSAGAVFFYTLPEGTSTAKLMIFSVSGRLVFETSLDVGSTRFPSAGTWSPVDNDGVALANGPYVYVLIANGKVIGRGKMVIQR